MRENTLLLILLSAWKRIYASAGFCTACRIPPKNSESIPLCLLLNNRRTLLAGFRHTNNKTCVLRDLTGSYKFRKDSIERVNQNG